MTTPTPTRFERRTREARARLRADANASADGADALALFPSRNLYYLSGFREEPSERHLFLFVPAERDPAFYVPELYREQVRAASWVDDVRTWGDDDDPVAGLE